MPIDTTALLDNVDIVEVIGRYLQLDKSGPEYEACCPFHAETTPSFKVSPSKQFYHCFGCGAHGDAIAFVSEYRGIGFREASAEVADGEPPTTLEPPKPKAAREDKKGAAQWRPIMPVPSDAPAFKRTFSREKKKKWYPGEFVGAWPYHAQDGSILGYAARFEWDHQGKRDKDVVPITYCMNAETGEIAWRNIGFPKPRPMYGLHKLAANPGAVVLLVEGEKTADAAQRLMPDSVCMTWPGGCQGIKYIAWQALAGRKVLVWPDADIVGGLAAEAICETLKDIAAALKMIDPPQGVSDGWDLHDAESEGWTGERVIAHIKAAARLPVCLQPQQERPTPPEPPPLTDDYNDEDGSEYTGEAADEEPYRALGYDHGRYYYLAGKQAQVIELAASAHTKLNLISMATGGYWARRYVAAKESEGASWDKAADALMRQCERAGVYDPEKVRGRGAWWDGGRSLLHVGDSLIIDGERRALTDRSAKYIYEAAPRMHIDMTDPLSKREAFELIEVCRMLPWEKPISATLLAGWIMLAPICGALDWRPHIWITGGAGTGKSWIQEFIVGACIGEVGIYPQGNTTEPGVRQELVGDARPVIFDEIESTDKDAAKRIQSIMELARACSTESRAKIMKGTSSGKGMKYVPRSMFSFSSIGVSAHQYADKTRISVLSLMVDETKSQEVREAEFQALKARAEKLLTPEFCARLRARAVGLIGAIRENKKTFAAAGAIAMGAQRIGDQIGSMLAGAYALHNNTLIQPDEARTWIEKQDWSEEAALLEVKDEQSCLSHILEYVMRVVGDLSNSERSIGELLDIAISRQRRGDIGVEAAEDHLLRVGIKITSDGMLVSNTHTGMGKILAGTLWSKQWSRILKRVPGAEARNPERFGSGGKHRGIMIPFTAVTGK